MKATAAIPGVIGNLSAKEHARILLANYQYFFSEPLPLTDSEQRNVLGSIWTADYALVSHGTEADPLFNFGNLTALKLFEMTFCDFCQLPSRKSAETPSREERSRLLDRVAKQGCIDNYTGVRISATGRRFFIQNARVWNLYDEASAYYGQAAMFQSWQWV